MAKKSTRKTRESRAAPKPEIRTVRAVVDIRSVREGWGLALGPGSVIDLNEQRGGKTLREHMSGRESCLHPPGWTPPPAQTSADPEPAETETEE